MAGGGLTWHGIAELEAAFTAAAAKATVTTREAVLESAHLTELAMKKRAGEGGSHSKDSETPASHGGGPAVISGTLQGSIQILSVAATTSGASAKVAPTAYYARWVEFKYDFPFTEPGLEAALPEIRPVFARAWSTIFH